MDQKIPLSGLCILCVSFAVQANTYKCTDKDGKVSYGTSPCKEEQVEKEIKEIKPSIGYDSIQTEVEQKRMNSLQNYEDSKVKENCRIRLNQELDKRLINPDAIKALTDCVNGSRSGGVMDSSETELNLEKSRMENELLLKEMELRNEEMRQQNEIRRMESQQRLNEAFPPLWNR